MTEQIPWADAHLSAEIPDVQIAGEGQHIEFKRELDTDDVRREIAAFATSGGGRLFVGIDDDGKLNGISISDVKARDQLAHRLNGIARSVRPSVRFDIVFAVVELQVVACVTVDKQQDYPVFYSNQKPYVRDGRTSRPAEPEEVQEQVWAHPTSEHKRNLQQLRFENLEQQISHMAEQSRKSSEQRHALRQRFIHRR